jgi:hypothetical protein
VPERAADCIRGVNQLSGQDLAGNRQRVRSVRGRCRLTLMPATQQRPAHEHDHALHPASRPHGTPTRPAHRRHRLHFLERGRPRPRPNPSTDPLRGPHRSRRHELRRYGPVQIRARGWRGESSGHRHCHGDRGLGVRREHPSDERRFRLHVAPPPQSPSPTHLGPERLPPRRFPPELSLQSPSRTQGSAILHSPP